ncbi:hypothetical protein ACI65C_003279 [Semiaphis heraclei]
MSVLSARHVLNNYIAEDAKFLPSLWAKEPTDEPCTTNGTESFHTVITKTLNSQSMCLSAVLAYFLNPNVNQSSLS